MGVGDETDASVCAGDLLLGVGESKRPRISFTDAFGGADGVDVDELEPKISARRS